MPLINCSTMDKYVDDHGRCPRRINPPEELNAGSVMFFPREESRPDFLKKLMTVLKPSRRVCEVNIKDVD